MAGVLFVHNNFPAQFRDLAEVLVGRGVACQSISQAHSEDAVPGVPFIKYKLPRGTTIGIFPLAVRAEADMIRGSMAMRAAQKLKEQGFTPDSVPAEGVRVRLRRGKLSTTDGPFAEAKEVVGGLAIVKAGSRAEAIEWAKKFLDVAGDGETRIFQLYEDPAVSEK